MDASPRTLRDYSKARLDILKLLRDAGCVHSEPLLRSLSDNPTRIHQEVEIPHIVTVGLQSVGKSSVNEAISTVRSDLQWSYKIRCSNSSNSLVGREHAQSLSARVLV
jgi:hypothetical protein